MLKKQFSLKAMMLFAFCLMLMAASLQKANAQGMMQSPEERAKQLKEQLKLDDDQTKKVEGILKAAQEKVQEAMSNATDRDAMRKNIVDLRAKTDKEIEALLTKDQKKKYEEVKKERAKRMRGFMQGQGNSKQ